MSAPPWSVDQLTADLEALGVAAGDVVMVHASLRAIGPVEGGARGVIDALLGAIGPEGTLVMTIGARDDTAWVNERPEDERPALLAGAVPFDHLVTPADPDVGVLAEVFRTDPRSTVSDHPEGRFAIAGHRASSWVADLPWDDYYGAGSVLERVVQAGGKVLRLGADPDTVTMIHYAEHLVELAPKRRVRRHRLVRHAGTTEIRVVTSLDDSDGIVDHPGEDYFATILRGYLETGRAATGTVGRARSELLDAADLVAFARGWMQVHLQP